MMEIERIRKEFFIKDAGETIGMVGVVEDGRSTRRTIPGKRVYLQDLKIKETFRRKGYATKLLEYVIKSYEEQGIYEITIAVDSKNEPAKKLYEKLGFSLLQRGFDCYRNRGYELLIHRKEE